MRDHQQDCLDAFLYATGVGTTPPTCDEQDNGVGYDSLLEAGQWSFDPAGVVDNVEISVGLAHWAGVHPLEGMLDECESADENDRILFLELDPDPGSKFVTLVAGEAALYGPSLNGSLIEGLGVLGSMTTGCLADECSMMAIVIDTKTGSASLEDFDIRSAGAAEVGTSDENLSIEDFRVQLWDRVPAMLDEDGETLTIPPGDVWFALSAAAQGALGVIAASNATPIVIGRDDDGWSSSKFTIAHQDALGDLWVLAIESAQWH